MNQVTLEAVLAAKERLAFLQAELRCTYQIPVVSVTLNIPGSTKKTAALEELLRAAVDRFREAARDNGFSIAEERFIYPLTGPAAVMAVAGAADKIKQACITIEESGFYARLFDMDVFDAAGRQITRRSLGYGERTCFLCSQSAVLCRRSGEHTGSEIGDNVGRRLLAFTAAATDSWPAIVWASGAWAVEAMLMEAACTPAPGLVDRDNTGAHRDMDFFSFLTSSSALAASMFRCAAAGYRHQGTPAELLPVLRLIGQEGERQMLQATGGVNTQKGLLFLLGILTAATTYSLRSAPVTAAGHVLDTAAAITSGLVANELVPLKSGQKKAGLTAGEKLYVKYGVTGIRGEMEAGMPSIRTHGLPVLRTALRQGLSLNDALVHTLLSLMSVVADTTILHRHDMAVLGEVQNQARVIIKNGGMLTTTGRAEIAALDKTFIDRNVSPGGVADLLAATYFLYLVEINIGRYMGGN